MSEGISYEFALSAAGNYEPDAQLNPMQIEALKKLFTQLPDAGYLRDLVVEDIVTGLLVRDTLAHHADGSWEIEEDEVDLLNDERVVGLIGRAAFLGSHWQQGFMLFTDLDGAEWPESMTPPATYAEPLKSDKVVDYLLRLHTSNPEVDFSDEIELYKSITGAGLEQPGVSDG